jgi:glycosyltransferase involved in cell wall biosynthesis
MRILVVTNLYPPHYVGGYELGCRDIVEKLRERGHPVHVLTSSFRRSLAEGVAEEAGVERVLQFHGSAAEPAHRKRVECDKLLKMAHAFAPDVIYFWNQDGLCRWLPLAVQWGGYRQAFFLSDTSFTAWRVGAWLAAAARKFPFIHGIFQRSFLVRGKSVIRNRACHFASDFLRRLAAEQGIEVSERDSLVAHWGIEPARFTVPRPKRWPLRKLLYVGQIIPQKGVHTAITAFALLSKEKEASEFTLTVAGGGQNPEYERMVREMPVRLGIAERVEFLGRVPRADLPRIYAEHDVLVFPSEWEEPFAITPLEAMAAGLVVVGTTTGGSGELFRNRETAMTFAAGDHADCARAIRETCGNPELYETMSDRCRKEVLSTYTLEQMVDRVERGLKTLISENRNS